MKIVYLPLQLLAQLFLLINKSIHNFRYFCIWSACSHVINVLFMIFARKLSLSILFKLKKLKIFIKDKN